MCVDVCVRTCMYSNMCMDVCMYFLHPRNTFLTNYYQLEYSVHVMCEGFDDNMTSRMFSEYYQPEEHAHTISPT